jgi:hypothetical protein
MENKIIPIRYIIKEKSWMARLAAWKLKAPSVAFVLGHTIHLHNTTKEEFLNNAKWLKHELRHVQQFEEYGFFSFILQYLKESLVNGYKNNKFEIEARQAENEG